MRALFCESRSVLEHQSLLLTPRTLGRGDEILDRAFLLNGSFSLHAIGRWEAPSQRCVAWRLRHKLGHGSGEIADFKGGSHDDKDGWRVGDFRLMYVHRCRGRSGPRSDERT